ncbi:MAG: bacillithiol biosynthesis deacetylase BshB1 [Planctomycetota bacterium]
MIDVLAFGAHPDDVEIQCGGTLLKMHSLGYTTGIADLTRGEMGTRGTPEERQLEAEASAKILKLTFRENLELPDGHLQVTEAFRQKVALLLRKHRPKILLAPYFKDSHPDHAYGGKLVFEGAFIAGLRKYDLPDEAYRPATILYYPSHYEFSPSFVIDITPFYSEKLKAVYCYQSQLYQAKSQEPSTNISSPDFQERLDLRSRYYGESIGVRYGEPFWVHQLVPVEDPVALFGEKRLEWNGMFGLKTS